MIDYESLLTERPKQRVLNLLREQAEGPGWTRQDSRNLLYSGDVRFYRYRDNPKPDEEPQFYEEYRAHYRLGILKGSEYIAGIPSGVGRAWEDADLLTVFGINTATGKIGVSQLEAPMKDPADVDHDHLPFYSLYGIDRQEEDVQWRALEVLLDRN